MPKTLKDFLTWNAVNFVGQAAVSLLAIPVYYHHLRPEAFAILSLIWTTIAMSAVMDFGLGRSLTRALATITNEKFRDSYLETASSGIVAALLYSMVAGLVALVVAPAYLERTFAAVSLRTGLIVSIAFLVFSTLFANALISIFEGMHRIGTASVLRLTSILVMMGVPAALLSVGAVTDLSAVLTVAIAGRVIQLMLSLALTIRMRVFSVRSASWAIVREMFATGKWLTISNVTGIMIAYSDRLIIGVFFSAPVLATYALASELIQRGTSLFAVVSNSVFPLISGTVRSTHGEHHLRRTSVIMLALGGGGFLVAQLVATPLIRLWLGSGDITEVVRLFRVMLWGWAVVGWAQLQLTSLHAAGDMRRPALCHLAEVVVSVPMLAVSLKVFGVVGAAVTWSIRAIADAMLLTLLTSRMKRID